MRFGLTLCALALASTLAAPPASAQAFPNRPVKMIVASVPGGILDIVGRTVAAKMAEDLGQPIVVENKPGAGGVIGGEAMVKSPADGYTILKVATSHAINPSVYAKLPYDTIKDYAPITQTVRLTNMLVVHPSVPANNLRELIALAKAKPRTLTFGSAGNGQSNHLSGELMAKMAGIELVHVPYKGSAASLNDLLAGSISMMFVDVLSAVPHVKSGRLKAIAVTGLERSAAAPEYPTLHESGVPGFNGSSWLGLVAPAGTPKEIVARLNAAAVKALRSPEVRENFLAKGVEPVGSSPEEYAAFIESEIPRWAEAARAAGIKPQ